MNRFLVLLLATAAIASSGCTGFPEGTPAPGDLVNANVVALDLETGAPIVWGLSSMTSSDGMIAAQALHQAFDGVLGEIHGGPLEVLFANNVTTIAATDAVAALKATGQLAKFGVPITFAIGSEESGLGAEFEAGLYGLGAGDSKVFVSKDDPTRNGYHQTVRTPQRLDVTPAESHVSMNVYTTQIGKDPIVGDRFDLNNVYQGEVVALEEQSANPFTPSGEDTDGDGFTDSDEARMGTDPNDASDPAGSDDADQDGLTNAQEWTFGTDPSRKDTDGDGIDDGSVTYRFAIMDGGQRDPADVVGAILLSYIKGNDLVRDLEPDVGATFNIQTSPGSQAPLGLAGGFYRTEGAEDGNLVYAFTPLRSLDLMDRAVEFHVEVVSVTAATVTFEEGSYGKRNSPQVRGNPLSVEAGHHHEEHSHGEEAGHHDEPAGHDDHSDHGDSHASETEESSDGHHDDGHGGHGH